MNETAVDAEARAFGRSDREGGGILLRPWWGGLLPEATQIGIDSRDLYLVSLRLLWGFGIGARTITFPFSRRRQGKGREGKGRSMVARRGKNRNGEWGWSILGKDGKALSSRVGLYLTEELN